ncbi:hypothetical protein Bca4012_055685 [Brassica carinata]
MAKKALLIGINYPGTAVELRGCVNDVRRMQRCLIDRYGFSNKDITVLIDTDKSSIQPTGKNIREALKKLIAEGESGDVLVFHYSGHGTRLPTEQGMFDATDYDECITPCDMNLITDNEFREMVAEVKKGCLLTIISDSCHSGGLIEEAKEQIGESYVKYRIATFFISIVRSLLTTCGISSNDSQRGSGGGHDSFTRESELEDDGETVDMKTRYLPLDSYITLLKEQTGQTDIKPGKIRQTLVKVFGEDSSPNVMQSNSMKRNGDRGFLSMFVGKREVNTDGAGSEVKSKVPNNGILLSGCQTDQRSEDVYVTRTGKAYGAFSDAIQTILSETRKEITNKEMVLRAREILKRQRFIQRPEDTVGGEPIVPCGLVAWSLFNDTYDFTRNNQKLSVNKKDISWKSDRDSKFGKNVFPKNFQKGSPIGGKSLDPKIPLSEQEDLIVWMRTAALPIFRKLYGKIDTDLEAGDTIKVLLQNNYNTYSFNGKKKLVLSTTSWLGGRNDFLGIAYLTVGSICLSLAVFFSVLYLAKPRQLGDPSYLSWNRSAGGGR